MGHMMFPKINLILREALIFGSNSQCSLAAVFKHHVLYLEERPTHPSPARQVGEAVPVSESLSVRLCLCLPTLLGVVPNAHAETLNPMNGVVLDDIDNRKATIGSVVTEMMAICSPTFQQRLMTMKRRNPWLAILATLVLVMPGCALKPEKQSSRFGYVPHSKQAPGQACNCYS